MKLGTTPLPPNRRLFGKYRGIVVQVDEQSDNYPEQRQQRGRIRAVVPSLTGPYGVLPWALPCFPMAAGPSPSDARQDDEQGVFYVPRKGSLVWIEFEQGDPSKPVWTGCFFPARTGGTVGIPKLARGEKDGTEGVPQFSPSHSYTVGPTGAGADYVRVAASPSPADPNGTDYAAKYPHCMVFKTSSGHTIELDDTKGAARIRIRHRTGSQIQFRHDGSVKIYAAKELHLVAEDRIVLKAPEVKAGAGDQLSGVLTKNTQGFCMVTGLPMSATISTKVNT